MACRDGGGEDLGVREDREGLGADDAARAARLPHLPTARRLGARRRPGSRCTGAASLSTHPRRRCC